MVKCHIERICRASLEAYSPRLIYTSPVINGLIRLVAEIDGLAIHVDIKVDIWDTDVAIETWI
jgi:hypothetical protein